MYGLDPIHFYVPAHMYIYTSIAYLSSRNTKPSPEAIMEILSTDKMKESINELGGVTYLLSLQSAKIDVNSLDVYCDKVIQSYTRIRLVEQVQKIEAIMYSDTAEVLNPSELLQKSETLISDVGAEVDSKSEDYKFGDETEEILNERAESPDVVPGIEVGWTKFDRYTNGGQPGDLIMLCARSKVGKSAMLLNWAKKIGVYDKIPTLYIDTEMNNRDQEDRLLASISGVPHDEVVSGMYMKDTENGTAQIKREKLKVAVKQMKEGNLHYISMPTFTIDTIRTEIKRYILKYGIEVVIFDYLKFPASQTNNLKNAQEWQHLGFIASGLKDIATTMGIPIYSACQENRGGGGEGEQKSYHNVGGSDRILQLATKLIFLYNKSRQKIQEDGLQNGNQELYIAYQRNGMSECPPIDIMFDRPYLNMREV